MGSEMCIRDRFTNLLIFVMCVCVFAQPHEEAVHTNSCGHTHELEEFYKKHPDAKRKAEVAKTAFANRLRERAASGETALKSGVTKRIPVVFHVIYGACGEGNIEKSRIDEAVQQLNDDFQGINGQDQNLHYFDRVGSMDIEFFLAEKDPNGNPTIGITRTESDLTYAGVGHGPELRELIMWPRNTYLNVYVVNQINSRGSSGVAIYPEGAEDYPGWDGIAMADWAVGPSPTGDRKNYNTIISHEVGHWLGLRHIWGDDNGVEEASSCGTDDFEHLDAAQAQYVADVDNPSSSYPESIYNDTPNTIGNSTFKTGDFCPEVSGVDKCSGEDIDMLENIMDYTRCAVMFTKGQVNYMNEVLEDGIAERNQIPLNASSVTLGSTRRVVFQDATLKESETNNGTVNYSLDIQLIGTSFAPNTLLQNTHYTIGFPSGFNSNNLQVSVTKTSPNTATLQVTGSTTTHNEDVELTVVFQSSAFTSSVSTANRTKVLRFDFIEFDGPVYTPTTEDLYVGPNNRWYAGKRFASGLQVGFGYYSDTDRYFVYAEYPVEIGIQQDGSVQMLNSGSAIPSASDFASSSYPHHTVDLSSVNNGEEFYVSFRTGCSVAYNYGWVRAQKDPVCGELKVLDAYYNTTPGQSILAGFNTPYAAYNVVSMNELASGEFSTVEVELRNIPSGQGFKSSISSANISVVEAESSLPDDFAASSLSINRINATKVTVSLTTPTIATEDFDFKLIFNSSAFINNTAPFDMEETVLNVFFNNILNESIDKTLLHEPIAYKAFHVPRTNGEYYSMGIQAIDEGYLFFSGNALIPQIACKTANSQEVQLFDCGDDVDNLNFRPMGGGFTDTPTSLDGQVYIDMNDLTTWTNDFAYVVIKYNLGCTRTMTAWIQLGVTEPVVQMTIEDVALSEEPTGVLDVCDKGPCDPILITDDEDTRRLYIESVIAGGVANLSTHGTNAYQDHTDVVLPLQLGDNYVSFIQGNGVSDSGSQYDPRENAFWYAFIDFNNNNYFEGDELVLSYQGQDAKGYLDYIDPNTPLGTYKMRIVVSYYDLSDRATDFACSPTSGHTYGETEDYTVNLLNSLNCMDTDNDGICSLNDCDDNNPNLPTTPGTPCNDGNPGSDNDVIQEDGCTCKGVITPNANYCTPNIPTNDNDAYIRRVDLEELSHDSGNEGYADFTTVDPAYLSQSESHTLYVYRPSDDTKDFYWSVWIDYNQDGDLNDPGELVIEKVNHYERYILESFTVPDDALNGPTLMRIHLKEYISSAPDPCGNNDGVDAEIEDYTVIIGSSVCSADADDDGVCAADDCDDSDPTLPATPGTTCDDGDPNTDNDMIMGDGCTCQGSTTPPPSAEYCTPDVPTNDNDVYIYKVNLEQIDYSSGNEGYGDFTSTPPAYLNPGDNHTLYAYKPQDADSKFYWRVWIDYNQDGDFNDADELIIHKVNQTNYYILETFTVPTNVPNGATRMRIHLREYISDQPDPCGNDDGVDTEIEDYTVIIGADTCEPFYDISGTVNPELYKAEDYIESDGQVLAGSSVYFQAGNLVRLLPGFTATADASSKFLALIDECTTNAPKEDVAVTDQINIRNYPNPFTGQTTIEFTLTEDTPITLWVTDAMGRKVVVLKDGEQMLTGTHEINFDGSNHAAGMYYYTIQAGEYTGTQKMVLIK